MEDPIKDNKNQNPIEIEDELPHSDYSHKEEEIENRSQAEEIKIDEIKVEDQLTEEKAKDANEELEIAKAKENEVIYKKVLEFANFTEQSKVIVKDYICPLCGGVLNNPLFCKCDDSFFCEKCYEQYKASVPKGEILLCPKSKVVMSSEPTSIKSIRSIIDKNSLYCKNKEKGCQFLGTITEYLVHIEKECPKEKIKCNFEGCQQETERDQMPKHQETCDYRMLNCEYCGKKYTFICLKQEHYDECERYPVKCSLGCGEVIERSNLQIHVDEHCPFKEVKCPLFNLGCETKVKRAALPEHIKNNSPTHFTLLANAFDKKFLGQTTEDFVRQKDFNSFKDEIKSDISSIRSDLNSLNYQFQAFTKRIDSSVNNLLKAKDQKAESAKKNSSPFSEKDSQYFFEFNAKNPVKKAKPQNSFSPKTPNAENENKIKNVPRLKTMETKSQPISPMKETSFDKSELEHHYLGCKRKEPEYVSSNSSEPFNNFNSMHNSNSLAPQVNSNFSGPQMQSILNFGRNHTAKNEKPDEGIPEDLFDLSNISNEEGSAEGNKLKICSKQDNKTGVHKYIFLNVKLTNQSSRTWKIKFKTLNGWICLGLCDKELVKANGYKFYNQKNPKSHGTFSVSSNNIVWNTNNTKEDNTKLEQYGINVRNVFEFEFIYDPFDQNLMIKTEANESAIIITNVMPIKDDVLTPVIAFLNTSAELEVIFGD